MWRMCFLKPAFIAWHPSCLVAVLAIQGWTFQQCALLDADYDFSSAWMPGTLLAAYRIPYARRDIEFLLLWAGEWMEKFTWNISGMKNINHLNQFAIDFFVQRARPYLSTIYSSSKWHAFGQPLCTSVLILEMTARKCWKKFFLYIWFLVLNFDEGARQSSHEAAQRVTLGFGGFCSLERGHI